MGKMSLMELPVQQLVLRGFFHRNVVCCADADPSRRVLLVWIARMFFQHEFNPETRSRLVASSHLFAPMLVTYCTDAIDFNFELPGCSNKFVGKSSA